jgi:hypothetical protein
LQGQLGREVLQELKGMATRVANKRSDEHERAEVWLSIRRLEESLEKSPDAGSIPGLWHRAIQATNAWRAR